MLFSYQCVILSVTGMSGLIPTFSGSESISEVERAGVLTGPDDGAVIVTN